MSVEVLDHELFNFALINPLFSVRKPDRLCIVSGYATHAMASRHLLATTARRKQLDVELVYGMAGVDGVRKADHLGFISLEGHKEFDYAGSFSCSYVKRPQSVHSKVYVWCKGESPVQAFIGSANYTENGFNVPSRTETLAECDPVTAFDFFHEVKSKTVLCSKANRDKDFPAKVRGYEIPEKVDPVLTIETDPRSPYKGCLKAVLPLINRKGHFGDGSGLNWGVMSDGTPRLSNKRNPSSFRNPNEAYIRVPRKIAMTDFFPEYNTGAKKKEEQIRFTIVTDDNQVFSCVRTSGGFGKEIETPQDNSELGRYFRRRLGVPSGAYIDVQTMKRYGRSDVTFYKTGDDSFVMDFSRP